MKTHILRVIRADRKLPHHTNHPDSVRTLHHDKPIARKYYPIVIKLAERYKVVVQYDYIVSQLRVRSVLTLKVFYIQESNAMKFCQRLDLIIKHIEVRKKMAVKANKAKLRYIKSFGKAKRPKFYKLFGLRGKTLRTGKQVADEVESYEIKDWAKKLNYKHEKWKRGEKQVYREHVKFYKVKLGLYSHLFTKNPNNKNRILA